LDSVLASDPDLLSVEAQKIIPGLEQRKDALTQAADPVADALARWELIYVLRNPANGLGLTSAAARAAFPKLETLLAADRTVPAKIRDAFFTSLEQSAGGELGEAERMLEALQAVDAAVPVAAEPGMIERVAAQDPSPFHF